MKLLYLHQYFKFPNESGGTRSYDLATGFLNCGHNVEILTSTSDQMYRTDERWFKIEKKGLIVHYIYLPYKNEMSYSTRTKVFIKFLWFSTLKLLSLKGDAVLATSTPLTIGVPALIKKWIQKTPFIFETRDVWPEAVIAIGAIRSKLIQKFLYFLEHLIYKNASAIVPLSIDMKESITSRYPELVFKKIEVIENISDINRFQKGFNSKKSFLMKKIGFKPRFTILYAGAFGRVNGLDYVIELASKLFFFDPKIVFVLIGNGVEKNSILKKVTDKDLLNKNIFILESVPKQDLPQIYYESDMGSSFVIPIKELWSNSANKFFDTLAAGKPILINYEGWQKEVIKKTNIGYGLPSIINEKAIENFLSYTQNKILIREQKENAFKIAKENYATNIAVQKYNKIFKSIIIKNV